jgi:hypothetical protein
VKKLRRRTALLPPWNMPSDPVKAVFWFVHWSLRVLVRYCWILILAGVIYEGIINGVVGAIVTLLVGLTVWLGIAAISFVFSIGLGISRTVSDINRIQRDFSSPFSSFDTFTQRKGEGKIVEGTITDLDEERKKRRKEL